MNNFVNSKYILNTLSKISDVSKHADKVALIKQVPPRIWELSFCNFGTTSKWFKDNYDYPRESYFNENLYLDLMEPCEFTRARFINVYRQLDCYGRELVNRILDGDLRANVGHNLINKAYPGLIKTFNCQLASPFDPIKSPKYLEKLDTFYVEEKHDGMRGLAFVDGDQAIMFSREGNRINSVPYINDQLLAVAKANNLKTCVFDGELKGSDFNETMKSARRKVYEVGSEQNINYYIFDFLENVTLDKFYDKSFKYETPLSHRVSELSALNIHRYSNLVVNDVDVVYTISDLDLVKQKAADIIDKGGEGVIIKDPTAPYEMKRTKTWLKIKDRFGGGVGESSEFQVIGVKEGTGKYKGKLGSLVIQVADGIVSYVGTGFSDELRETLWEDRDCLLDRMIEVEYHEYTNSGNLRNPRFVKFRDSFNSGEIE